MDLTNTVDVTFKEKQYLSNSKPTNIKIIKIFDLYATFWCIFKK